MRGRVGTFPRRDDDGRVATVGGLFAGALFALLLGALALLVIDGLFTLAGSGRFGDTSGWLAGILAVWLYVEDFRAWRGVRGRAGILLVAMAIAGSAGYVMADAMTDVPALLSGAVGVTVAVLAYAPLWFLGIRWLATRVGDDGHP